MTLGIAELAGLLVGLLLGSFLNVVIARVPAGESVVRPRSRCRACQQTLHWYDNVPVVSWILLRGKCRACGGQISWRYPAVELAAGLWLAHCAGLAWHVLHLERVVSSVTQPVPTDSQIDRYLVALAGIAVLGLLLIALTVIDWQTQTLPDGLTLSGIAVGLFAVCTEAIFLVPSEGQIIFASKHLRLSSPGSFAARGNVFLTGTEALIFGRVAAVCGAALILLLVRWGYKAWRGQDGLGLGDVKLLAMVAAFLGFWPAVLTLFGGTLLGSVYGGWLLARRQAGRETRLPFGSFLGAAGLAVALRGDAVIGWYAGLFR